MAQDAQQSLSVVDRIVGPAVREFSARFSCPQSVCGLPSLEYRNQLAARTHQLFMSYFGSLRTAAKVADINSRVCVACRAAWLLPTLRYGATIDDVLGVSCVATSQMVSICSPDIRLFAPRRIQVFVSKLAKLPLDSKILLLADCGLTIELQKELPNGPAHDLYQILTTMNELNHYLPLASARTEALKLLNSKWSRRR